MNKVKPYQISKHSIWEAWKCVKSNAGAAGIDRESLADFELNLSGNLYKIWNRMSSGSYFPPAVLGVPIPKKQGGTRTLGVPTVSDRVAQTVVKLKIEPQLEKVFLDDSYGYRPGRSAHDAISITRKRCWRYDWVLEFDIKGLFDNLPWGLILKAVRHHVKCKWSLLYIERWLKASLKFNDGTLRHRTKGVPQGGCISPILSNLFMHYCFDFWMEQKFPTLKWCRYADDGLIHCHSRRQAEYVKRALSTRLNECGLELHPEKTKVVYCRDSKRSGEADNYQFDFLGYTFKSRPARSKKDGNFQNFSPGVSDSAQRSMRRVIKYSWRLEKKIHISLADIAAQVNPVIRGWMNYYCKFNSWSMFSVCNYINMRIRKWAKKKYKNLRGKETRACNWLKRVCQNNRKLFAHWQVIPVY